MATNFIMESNTYFGVWSPEVLGGAYPTIDNENINFAAWYILENYTDEAANISYKEGDWLVYIYENGNKYWKVTDGIALLNTSPSFNTPEPGSYTKLQLDHLGNIVAGSDIEYEDLPPQLLRIIEDFNDENLKQKVFEISKSLFSQEVSNPLQFKWDEYTSTIQVSLKIDETTLGVDPDSYELFSKGGSGGGGEGGGDCANHHHDVTDIDGLESFIQNYIAQIKLVDEIRNNLYNLVDGRTIIINGEGKLSAVAMAVGPHKHTMKDITDLDPQKADTWASRQGFHNENIDFNQGIVPLENTNIGEAISALNTAAKDIDKKAQEALDNAGKLEPVEPGTIETAELKLQGNIKTVLNTTSLQKEEAYLEPVISTKSIIYLHNSKLEFYLDDEKIDTFDTEKIKGKGKFLDGRLTITYFGDAYPFAKILQGKYLGYSFDYKVAPPKEGHHIFKIVELPLEEDKTAVETLPIEFNTYDPVVLPNTSITLTSNDGSFRNSYVSGVSTYKSEKRKITLQIASSNISQYFAPLEQFTISNSLFEDTLVITNAYYSNKQSFFNYSFEIPETFEGNVIVIAKAKSLDDTYGTSTTWKSSYINIDTTYIETKYRVINISDIPNISTFNTFNSVSPLTLENKECQFIDNKAVIASKNYEPLGIGPDYSKLEVPQSFTLSFPIDDKKLDNIYFNLIDKEGKLLSLGKYDTLKDIDIKIAVSKSNNVDSWIDGNSPWNGRDSKLLSKNFSGLDLFRSTQKTRWIVFGINSNNNYGKNLFIKITLKTPEASIDLVELERSLQECLNER